MLASIGDSMSFVDLISERFPLYSRLVTGAIVVHFGMLFYCIYTGISLWKARKGGAAKAQMFLIAYLTFLGLLSRICG